jgi:hypothetical protein
VEFALCAMSAHGLGFTHISLIAGDGSGRNTEKIGDYGRSSCANHVIHSPLTLDFLGTAILLENTTKQGVIFR